MIPKFVIPLLYVFVLVTTKGQVSTDDGQEISSGQIATILKPESTTAEKSALCDEKVKIQLYYETLCPFCIEFGSREFVDTVIALQSYLDVHVYPFGNARVEEDGSITCQHGPEECYGNKMHACAIDYLGDMIKAVIFNGCMLGSDLVSNDAAADECASQMGVASEPIKSCAKGPKGEELLKFYGDESKKVHYKGVPTVLINEVAGRTDHFRSDVCNSFKNPPEPCRK